MIYFARCNQIMSSQFETNFSLAAKTTILESWCDGFYFEIIAYAKQ